MKPADVRKIQEGATCQQSTRRYLWLSVRRSVYGSPKCSQFSRMESNKEICKETAPSVGAVAPPTAECNAAPAATMEKPLSNEPNNCAGVWLAYSNDSDDEEMMQAMRTSLKEITPTPRPLSRTTGFYPIPSTNNNAGAYTTPPAMGPPRVTPSFASTYGGLLMPSSGSSSGRSSAPPTVYTQVSRPVLPTRKVVPKPVTNKRPAAPVATTIRAAAAAPKKKAVAATRRTSVDTSGADEEVLLEPDDDDDEQGLNQSTKFRAAELDYLMEVVADIKPIGKIEWDRVTTRYNARFKTRPRIMRNLRNRFQAYANKKPPTGDPDCPPLVRKAKQITEAIKSKAGMAIITSQNNTIEVPLVASKRNADDVVGKHSQSTKTKGRSGGGNERFLEAYLASERLQAKRDAKEEKMRHLERQETMRLMMTTMASFAAAMSGKSVDVPRMDAPSSLPPPTRSTSLDSDDDSDESNDSDPDTDSSTVTMPKKKKRFNEKLASLRRKQKKLKKALKKAKSPDKKEGLPKQDDDEDSDSGSEYEVNAVDFYCDGGRSGII
jgi:hypothetical protein